MFSSECVSLYEIEGVSRLVWEREREREREREIGKYYNKLLTIKLRGF